MSTFNPTQANVCFLLKADIAKVSASLGSLPPRGTLVWKMDVPSKGQNNRRQTQGKFYRKPQPPLMFGQVRNHEEKAKRGTTHDEEVYG